MNTLEAKQEKWEERNASLIEEFIENIPPVTPKRQQKYRTVLTHISEWWARKSFDQVIRPDLNKVVGSINTAVNPKDGQEFKDWTKSDYRMILKRFFRYPMTISPEAQ